MGVLLLGAEVEYKLGVRQFFVCRKFSVGYEVHHLRPLFTGNIDSVTKTAEFGHCGLLPHFSNLWVRMPQKVTIFHSDAYIRIDDVFGA